MRGDKTKRIEGSGESKRIEEGESKKIGREENKKDSEGGRKEIGYGRIQKGRGRK